MVVYPSGHEKNPLKNPEKSPALKNSWLRVCSWLLSNMFKSLVYSFVYLTYHFTNIRTKFYGFCILSPQSQAQPASVCPKTILQQGYGKTQVFQSYGFLTGETEIYTNPRA